MVFLGRPNHWRFFKGCLLQILLGLFLNTLTHLIFFLKNFKTCFDKFALLEEKRIRFKPFVPNASFLYSLKTSENLTVFRCFQGVEKGCTGNEWVNNSILMTKSLRKAIKRKFKKSPAEEKF